MSEHSAQSLGRYTIHAELGKGGFATVYRATDTVLEREVALKILKPGWTDDAKAVERFMREAKQASRLRHTNIVTIYDVGQAEGRLFIAMELVRGRSLQQIIAEDGALPWPRALTILEQSAAALDYAHGEGLVHRDIKPANIILDESKSGSAVHVMLTDFGLVRGAEQASLSMGSTGGLLGTPEYIPPEIWDEEPATTASDIYALGCVAFYLLTGKVLFSATTPMAVLKRHAEGPVFPQQWPSGVPAGTEAVLRRALAKDPSQRQASSAELVAELRACEEQVAREQEAKQKEEAERTAQAMLAAEAARLAEEEARRKDLQASQQKAAAKPAQRPQAEVLPGEKSAPVPQTKSNRKWLYAAGGVIAVVAIAIVLASIKPAPPAPLPAPTHAPAPTQPHAAPTQASVKPTEAVQPTPVPTQPQAPTAVATATPFGRVAPASGLVSYQSQDESGKKTLYALGPDGVPVILAHDYADARVLTASPDRKYLLVAISQSPISPIAEYPRFLGANQDLIQLVAVPANGQGPSVAVTQAPAIDATYLNDGRLVVAVLESKQPDSATVTYRIYKPDGSDGQDLYRSDNVFLMPTPVPMPTTVSTP